MDIERGNIEILFQKIPYMYLLAPKDCSESFLGYNKVDEGLYMRYAADVFTCSTDDERRNNYKYMCKQMKNPNHTGQSVFRLIFDLADRMLRQDGEEMNITRK